MVKHKKQPVKKVAVNSSSAKYEATSPEEKIARMLGILALQTVKGKSEQASMLRSGGFSHAEIADMLGITENGVSVLLYQSKKKRAKKANDPDQS